MVEHQPAIIHWRYGKKKGRYETDLYVVEEDDYDGIYIWKEGNYSCDCNRSVFFGLGDFDCGDTIKVERIINMKTGIITSFN